ASLYHFVFVVEELAGIQPHERGRHHAGDRKRGVTSANAGERVKNLAEAVCCGDLLEVRTRIGDGDEVATGFFWPHNLLHPLEEILFEDVRLERRAGFA